ncbi:MAG TPA: D-TA family PLP-dependent enzyme [Pirellulales bacterium]|jgi:D-serine deaminase-like pyridoxal phosphate-dependent protein|nr:D-TA family PLP-dependent enzyme [Pirellulales bacterium]
MSSWYTIENAATLPTPALAVYPERIKENIRRMISVAGGVKRLRPHVKTHKLAEIVGMQLDAGITKFKCATLAEAEMLAGCFAPDVLLAYPLVGPHVERFVRLVGRFQPTHFSTIADDAGAIRRLAQAAAAAGQTIAVYLDLDAGMGRTGIAPDDPRAIELYRLLCELPGVSAAGLHVYDGQIRDESSAARSAAAEAAFAPVEMLHAELRRQNLPVPSLVVGGTPTFPIHARRGSAECSPGTMLLWDAGYSERYADLNFLHAAVLLTRVVSKPAGDRLTLDLGYKAVSPDSPPPRCRVLELPEAAFVMHSEEHLTLATPRASTFAVGDLMHAIPLHVCPTVALHAEVLVVEAARVGRRWRVARER